MVSGFVVLPASRAASLKIIIWLLYFRLAGSLAVVFCLSFVKFLSTSVARVETDDTRAHARLPQSAGAFGTPGAGEGRRRVRQQVVGGMYSSRRLELSEASGAN